MDTDVFDVGWIERFRCGWEWLVDRLDRRRGTVLVSYTRSVRERHHAEGSAASHLLSDRTDVFDLSLLGLSSVRPGVIKINDGTCSTTINQNEQYSNLVK